VEKLGYKSKTIEFIYIGHVFLIRLFFEKMIQFGKKFGRMI
jgi:hypothetical protein